MRERLSSYDAVTKIVLQRRLWPAGKRTAEFKSERFHQACTGTNPSAPTGQPANDSGWSQSSLSSHRISASPLKAFSIRREWPELAEREGFEPPVPCGTTVFKTAAFDHSATSPCLGRARKAIRGRGPNYRTIFHQAVAKGEFETVEIWHN